MESILRTDRLTKQYGSFTAVDSVSLTVRPGDIYGFVGKNGAGKTTFIRMLLGLTAPTAGSFELFDGQEPSAARKRIGSLVEGPALYKNLTAYQNLELYAVMLGLRNPPLRELLGTVGLSDTGRKKAADFSLGMKQRLGIAMALLGDPELLILDEPINGLDPTGIVEIREMLTELQSQGKTIFISSHILGELEKIATRYGIISSGRLVDEITADELKRLSGTHTLIRTDKPEQAAEIVRTKLRTDDVVIDNQTVVVRHAVQNIGELTNALFTAGIVVSGLNTDESGAEEYFIRKMEEG